MTNHPHPTAGSRCAAHCGPVRDVRRGQAALHTDAGLGGLGRDALCGERRLRAGHHHAHLPRGHDQDQHVCGPRAQAALPSGAGNPQGARASRALPRVRARGCRRVVASRLLRCRVRSPFLLLLLMQRTKTFLLLYFKIRAIHQLSSLSSQVDSAVGAARPHDDRHLCYPGGPEAHVRPGPALMTSFDCAAQSLLRSLRDARDVVDEGS